MAPPLVVSATPHFVRGFPPSSEQLKQTWQTSRQIGRVGHSNRRTTHLRTPCPLLCPPRVFRADLVPEGTADPDVIHEKREVCLTSDPFTPVKVMRRAVLWCAVITIRIPLMPSRPFQTPLWIDFQTSFQTAFHT